MKTFLLMFFISTSVFAQSQFKTGDTITTEDKLRFLDSLNKYRIEAGVPVLEYSFQEDSLARLRTRTVFNYIDNISEDEYKLNSLENLHFNFVEDIKKYIIENIHEDSVLYWSAECSARLSKLNQADDLVNELFHGWKNSKEHWKVMLDDRYTSISLNWFIDNQRHIRIRKGTFACLVLFDKKITKSALKRKTKQSP